VHLVGFHYIVIDLFFLYLGSSRFANAPKIQVICQLPIQSVGTKNLSAK
jgi:hypothetical protein